MAVTETVGEVMVGAGDSSIPLASGAPLHAESRSAEPSAAVVTVERRVMSGALLLHQRLPMAAVRNRLP